jgi:iron complex outermembrane receptor protein
VLAAPNATIENNPNPRLDSNLTHSVSLQWDAGKLAFRVGVNNLTDKAPSYPSLTYGDIIGRQFYVGVKAKY